MKDILKKLQNEVDQHAEKLANEKFDELKSNFKKDLHAMMAECAHLNRQNARVRATLSNLIHKYRFATRPPSSTTGGTDEIPVMVARTEEDIIEEISAEEIPSEEGHQIT